MVKLIRQFSFYPLPLILLFSACKLGKEYQRPEVELPKQFEAKSFADTSSIADVEWKKFFTDPTLLTLIEKGLTYNHDRLAAIKRIEIAQQQLKQSKVLLFPEVVFQATGQISRPSDNSLSGISIKSFLGKSYVENYSTGVYLSWEADIWGKLRNQQDVALSEYLRTTEVSKAVQTELVANISQSYFNLLMLDRQLDIAHRNYTLNDSFVVVTRLLKDAGLGTALAVQRAVSQRQTTEFLIPQLEESIALQENTLQQLTGQLPGTVARSAGLNDIPLRNDIPTGLPLAMVSRRPDVRAAELALMSANSQIGIAQADMYPGLTLTAGGGLESFKASNWFNIPSSLFGLAAGSIAQPIFRRRALKTQFEIAKLQRDEAVIRFRQSVLQASTEVANALVRIDKLKIETSIAADQVDTLQVAVINAKLLFKSDMANYLEVITAQGNALLAELNLASLQRQQLDALVELYRSLGGGWK